MSLSHSLAADVLSRTSSNMLNNPTESLWSRQSDSAVSLVPRATKAPHDPAFLIKQRWRSLRSILTGIRRRKTPFQRLVSIDVKSGVEKRLATLDPAPDSILAGRISLHPDGNRLAVSFVRQDGKIYMLEGFDESTSWFERTLPVDLARHSPRRPYPRGRRGKLRPFSLEGAS